MKLRLPATLRDQAVEIVPLVLTHDLWQQLARPSDTFGQLVVELVGDREDQVVQRFLILRVDLKDIEVNALGGNGVVEQPVALRFLESSRDAFMGDGLQGSHAGR